MMIKFLLKLLFPPGSRRDYYSNMQLKLKLRKNFYPCLPCPGGVT